MSTHTHMCTNTSDSSSKSVLWPKGISFTTERHKSKILYGIFGNGHGVRISKKNEKILWVKMRKIFGLEKQKHNFLWEKFNVRELERTFF